MAKLVMAPVIKTERDYKGALSKIDTLMDAKRGTPGGDKLEVYVTLVEAYEAKHYPIDPPEPVEAIKFRMEQMGYDRSALAEVLGGNSRVSEVFGGKRNLSMDMARKLHNEWGVPAEILLQTTKAGVGDSKVAFGAFEPRHVQTPSLSQETNRDTYKYQFKVGTKVVYVGTAKDLKQREAEHQQKWAKGHIMQVGRRTTEHAARSWEKDTATKATRRSGARKLSA